MGSLEFYENCREELRTVRDSERAIYQDAAEAGRALKSSEQDRAERLAARGRQLEAAMEKHYADHIAMTRAAEHRLPMGTGAASSSSYPSGRSFLRDLALSTRGDSHSAAVIRSHDEVRREALAGESRLLTTEGAGAFIPTGFLPGEGFPYSGSPFWDWTNPSTLPSEGMTFEVPTVNAAMTAAAQTAQGSAVASSTVTVGTAVATVRTIAASTLVSFQSLDRATEGFDQVLLGELSNAVRARTEADALGGAGSPTFTGIATLGTADGASVISVGTADATGSAFIGKLAEGMAAVTGSVYEEVAGIFFSPRRWSWLAQQADSNGSPYIAPLAPAQGAQPQLTSVYGTGPVGYAFGVPVYLTGGMPLTEGDANNEDRVVILARNAVRTWQVGDGSPQRITLDVDGSTLRYRLTAYSYAAMVPTRPSGIAVLKGAGLANPY